MILLSTAHHASPEVLGLQLVDERAMSLVVGGEVPTVGCVSPLVPIGPVVHCIFWMGLPLACHLDMIAVSSWRCSLITPQPHRWLVGPDDFCDVRVRESFATKPACSILLGLRERAMLGMFWDQVSTCRVDRCVIDPQLLADLVGASVTTIELAYGDLLPIEFRHTKR